jgi:hypothetical protein
MSEELRARLNALPRKAEWEVMQDLLDGGAIRPECIAEFTAKIVTLRALSTPTSQP